jgi:hypothetical protein
MYQDSQGASKSLAACHHDSLSCCQTQLVPLLRDAFLPTSDDYKSVTFQTYFSRQATVKYQFNNIALLHPGIVILHLQNVVKTFVYSFPQIGSM